MTRTATATVYRFQPGSSIPGSGLVGGKAHHLARLQELGMRVPAWLVVLPEGVLDEDACAEITASLAGLGLADRLLAVRSSASVEDGEAASFAGQFRSVLGVRAGPQLWRAVDEVRQSAGTPHVRAYLARTGLPEPRVAVLVQEMVDALTSGVAFTRDPLADDGETVLISAVPGLGEGLVSGELDADAYRVRREGRVQVELAPRTQALRLLPEGGTRWEPVAEPAPCLTEPEARLLADTARRIESAFGAAQDIEWAMDRQRRLHILQSRPITSLPKAQRPTPNAQSGVRRLWDNSNIVESYGAVTTPLTFSFARNVYEHVYLQLCRVLGVEERLLQERRDVFAHMLGCIRGRVYYNLLNWYRALALLPGYSFNRAFMERMMGVRQKLADPPETPYAAGKWQDLGRLARMVGRLVSAHRGLRRDVPAFHRQVDAILQPLAPEDLERWSVDDLHALYLRLERELLEQWRAPLVNDFLAMICFGVLGRLVEKWLPDAPPTLVNDLLIAEGGIISTRPGEELEALGARIRADEAALGLFRAPQDPRGLWEHLRTAAPGLHRALEEYVERFGDRSAGELKLETVTPRQEPWRVLPWVPVEERPRPASSAGKRAEAEALALGRLRGVRRALFRGVLRATRERVRDRENLRFERTRVFGLARRIFLALGSRLAEQGTLRQPRDIFYLTREEILGYLEGTAPAGSLQAVVANRRSTYAAFAAEAPLPDRFETFGPPDAFKIAETEPAAAVAGDLRGTGCCPGVVRAPVRVVRDPEEAGDLSGRILVAERTDPGWTLLFPRAAGLLVQRGSLLSHSAIVAREVGLPCIVSVAGLMETLRDGEWVEMDGTTGEIRRVTA